MPTEERIEELDEGREHRRDLLGSTRPGEDTQQAGVPFQQHRQPRPHHHQAGLRGVRPILQGHAQGFIEATAEAPLGTDHEVQGRASRGFGRRQPGMVAQQVRRGPFDARHHPALACQEATELARFQVGQVLHGAHDLADVLQGADAL